MGAWFGFGRIMKVTAATVDISDALEGSGDLLSSSSSSSSSVESVSSDIFSPHSQTSTTVPWTHGDIAEVDEIINLLRES